MLLPWDYGVRNLARRPVRTVLTFLALFIVVLLILVVVGFIRGLEHSLAVSGDPEVALVYSFSSEENIESSSISSNTPELITASLDATWKRYGIVHASPEMFLGTRIQVGEQSSGLGLVRGVTKTAPLVRRSVHVVAGQWPNAGEVII